MSNYKNYKPKQQATIDKLQNTFNKWEALYEGYSKDAAKLEALAQEALPHMRRAETKLCNFLIECDKQLNKDV